MKDAGRWIARAFSLLAAVASVLGLVNTYGDDAEPLSRSEQLACGQPGCQAHLVRKQRNPFEQSYSYQIDRKGTAEVSCARSLVLLGAWECHKH